MSPLRCRYLLFLAFIGTVISGIGCSAPATLVSTPDMARPTAPQLSTEILTVEPTATPLHAFVRTAVATAEPSRALPIGRPTSTSPLAAPTTFSTTLLASFVHPQTYVDDLCQYLRARWDRDGSVPGTVVVPIMFHSVSESGNFQPGDTFVPIDDLNLTVQTAVELGFQTITASELVRFLEQNCFIPRRSMIWIVDDRRPQALSDHFVPIARANKWTITLAWPVDNESAFAERWQKYLKGWHSEGLIDVQSHGMKHLYIADSTPETDVVKELRGPIESIRKESGQAPVAHVWAGGNYTAKAVELAREVGYRVGFTINTRGPLMFNWIPLARREIEVGDPLMLLPRYPASPDLPGLLRKAAAMGDAAAAMAQEDFLQEALFYEALCGCELP